MKTYPKMKHSGVDWIGEIPNHWEILKLKFVSKITSSNIDKKQHSDSKKVKIIHYNDIVKNQHISHDYDFDEGYCTKSQYDLFNLKKGDIIITKDSMDVSNICDSCLIKDELENTVFGYHLSKFTITKNLLPEFLFYFLNQKQIKDHFILESRGVTIIGIGRDSLLNTQIVIPSNEQKIISEFLDRETKKIDSEIGKNQRLIELLKEKRQSTINQVVTKGLDTTVPMKDSGIDWIGEIPEHWGKIPLRHVLQQGKTGIKIGPFGSSLKLDGMVDSGYKVYGQENVIKSNFDLGLRFIDERKFSEMKGYELLEGDIIVTMMGTTGLAKVVPPNIKKGIMDSHLVRIRVNNNLCHNYFLEYLIDVSDYVKIQMKLASKGSIMEGLNSSILKSIQLVLPQDVFEQKQIVEFLDKKITKIDSLILKIENQIKQLQELRQSLISSAVTGKIDVRGAIA